MVNNDKNKTAKKMSKEKIERKNKIIKITLISIALIIIFVICFLLASGYFMKERKVNNSITNLGEKFYKDFYYEKVTNGKSSKDVENFFKQFDDSGIIVSLHNLEKYVSNGNEKDIKVLEKYKCDKYNTTITVYPKDPYKKNDFNMEINLSCSNIK